MRNAVGLLLITGVIVFSSRAPANVDKYAFTNSNVVYGSLASKSTLDGSIASGIKCGYFLTKGLAYKSWGPSLTFFIEDAAGTKDILYRMLNGTKNLDRIESLHMQTADIRKINKKNNTYYSIYQQNSGKLSSLLPQERNTLAIERRLSSSQNYSSERDINILKVNFKSDLLKRSQLRYVTSTNLTCSFGNKIAKF